MVVKRVNSDYPTAYRPCRISEVYGQERPVRIINRGLNEKSLAHSLLLHGPSGTGKTSVARIIAGGLVCEEGPTGEPCCECESCKRVFNLCHLSVIEVNGAGIRGADYIRKLSDEFRVLPMWGPRHKIFIFDECHQLSKEAQSILLKEIEDTWEGNYFIFCSTDPEKLIDTLRYRCMPVELTEIPPAEMERLLRDVCESEGVEARHDVLDAIITKANGMARNALLGLQEAVQAGDL